MNVLNIDLETFSSVNLLECGVYAYTSSPDFEILLFAYSFNQGPVFIIDLKNGQKVHENVLKMLTDERVIKKAANANFERTCLAKFYNMEMPPEQWRCTLVHALNLGLPGKLESIGEILGLDEDKQKMSIGKSLIKYFCVPCKPTKVNGQRTRNLPEHDPDKWETFKEYCKRDVITEMEIDNRLDIFPLIDFEHKLWAIDQRINDRGVKIDIGLVDNAIEMNDRYIEQCRTEAIMLTGLDNPNSIKQLTEWLIETSEHESIDSLTKKEIEKLIKEYDGSIIEL